MYFLENSIIDNAEFALLVALTYINYFNYATTL